MEQTPVRDTSKAIAKIFSSKTIPGFDKSEMAAIGEYQRALADRQWARTQARLNEDLKHEIALLRAGESSEPLRRAVALRRPAPSLTVGHATDPTSLLP